MFLFLKHPFLCVTLMSPLAGCSRHHTLPRPPPRLVLTDNLSGGLGGQHEHSEPPEVSGSWLKGTGCSWEEGLWDLGVFP